MKDYKIGTQGWGYKFKLNKNGNVAEINMKPTRGVLTRHYNKNREAENTDQSLEPLYFIPLKKDGTLRWKKHKRLDLIGFSTDKDYAVQKYDEMVTAAIKRRFKTLQYLTLYYINDLPEEIQKLLKIKSKWIQHNQPKGGFKPERIDEE